MNPAQASEPSRAGLPALTGARGLAAWFVVVYHIRPGLTATAPAALMGVLGKGYLAVDFFFMLSGFVLWLNYGGRIGTSGWRGARQFLGRRIARIWPLHIAILAATVALALLFEVTGRRDAAHYPWGELPLHVLLMQNWGFTSRLTWNDPAWSISCEWAAYLLFPLLGMAAAGRRVSSPVLVGLIVTLAVGLHLVMAGNAAAKLGFEIWRFGLLRALVEFGMGTVVCALWRRWHAQPAAPTTAGFALAALLFAATASGAVPETLAVPLLFAALLLSLSLTAARPANPLAHRAIVWLGEISYATYLVHFLLYIVFKLVFVADPFAVPLPLVALFLLMTLAASALLYHLVELPAQAALRRQFERPRLERWAAPAL